MPSSSSSSSPPPPNESIPTEVDEELAFEVTAASFDAVTGTATAALYVPPLLNAYETKENESDDDLASLGEKASVEGFQSHIHMADMDGHLVHYPAPGELEEYVTEQACTENGKTRPTVDETEDTYCDTDNSTTMTGSNNNNPSSNSNPPTTTTTPTTTATTPVASRSVISAGIESIKYLLSMALLLFGIVVVMASIFAEQTVATAEMNVNRWIACVIFWLLVGWLAVMEGGQAALVGLQPVSPEYYKTTHTKTAWTTRVAHRGNNMERFIVGRQFLVVLVLFCMNMMASYSTGTDDNSTNTNTNTNATTTVLGLTGVAKEIFLDTGVSLMLVAIILGQLTAQVNAANCMLDFINNYVMVFTTYVSLLIEQSGLLHSVYLVQWMFAKLAGNPMESNEEPRGTIQNIFFGGRVIFSLLVLGFAFAVTLQALFEGKTAMWDGVPEAVSVVLLFLLMAIVGMMEGMQIALFAVINVPEEELQQHKVAHNNCQLAFAGQNLQAFLIGRQILTTICMFVVARITTVQVTIGQDENIFGVSDSVQDFFNTGLLGAVITTIIGSLIWRIIASSFPVAFLSNPLIYIIIRLCLLVEQSGICSAAWVLARYHKPLMNYQPDEVYLEGAQRHTSEPVTRRDKDIDRLVTVTKFSYSLVLLGCSVFFVIVAIFQGQTTGVTEKGVPPIATFFIFWILIVWLAIMEGGQGALVSLQQVDPNNYAESHRRTLLNSKAISKGDNLEKFIVGRQFLVVAVVFFTNLMASAINDSEVLGLDEKMVEPLMFVAVVLVTIILGQLAAQVSAAWTSLDFLNNYLMLLTTYISLAVEMSGLLHSVYLVQRLFSEISGAPIETSIATRTKLQDVFFWGRVMLSVVILAVSLAVTLAALFGGDTTMWENVPPTVSVVLFFVLMCFIGMLEGIQIALFSVINVPEVELRVHRVAYRNCQLAFREHNLQAFLIGRQIFVTVCMFVLARISTINIPVGQGNNIFGVGDGLQEFFNTGVLGAVVATILASLVWRIIASRSHERSYRARLSAFQSGFV